MNPAHFYGHGLIRFPEARALLAPCDATFLCVLAQIWEECAEVGDIDADGYFHATKTDLQEFEYAPADQERRLRAFGCGPAASFHWLETATCADCGGRLVKLLVTRIVPELFRAAVRLHVPEVGCE